MDSDWNMEVRRYNRAFSPGSIDLNLDMWNSKKLLTIVMF
ncbi:2005_t:CDS:2 [Entrophospora sp. SA101]|nr:2005_t:CDS:2 [Entrophospora sp. SA101]